MKGFLPIAVLVLANAGTVLAHHESGGQRPGQSQAPVASKAAGNKTGKGSGLIQGIDRERGVVTIQHGLLQELNMPGMTVSFLVRDKAMLSSLQPLQKVEFELTYDGKSYLITKIKQQ